MFSFLRVSDEKTRDKMISSVKERVTSLSAHKNISKEDAYHALLNGFTKDKECFFENELPDGERGRAEELVLSRYSLSSWNRMR
jgi:lipoate-protein ligase A